MKITLEMQVQEQGDVTIRMCSCRPNGGYKSQGRATLNADGTGLVECSCGNKYNAEWDIHYNPTKKTSTVRISPADEEVLHVMFDSYREAARQAGAKK